jgi:hypothetical protein
MKTIIDVFGDVVEIDDDNYFGSLFGAKVIEISDEAIILERNDGSTVVILSNDLTFKTGDPPSELRDKIEIGDKVVYHDFTQRTPYPPYTRDPISRIGVIIEKSPGYVSYLVEMDDNSRIWAHWVDVERIK